MSGRTPSGWKFEQSRIVSCTLLGVKLDLVEASFGNSYGAEAFDLYGAEAGKRLRAVAQFVTLRLNDHSGSRAALVALHLHQHWDCDSSCGRGRELVLCAMTPDRPIVVTALSTGWTEMPDTYVVRFSLEPGTLELRDAPWLLPVVSDAW